MTESLRDRTVRLVSVSRDQEGWRTDAQVDVDRILYSPEFRRLAGVTQVVPPEDDFHFHDRLSHSIKVAQVAATLARMLIKQANDDEAFSNVDISEWVDPDHCFAAGLAHDIGHPPFGHAGEEALQELLESMGANVEEFWESETLEGVDETKSDGERLAERSFEGNAQSTRVVSALSFRGDGFNAGLNLTLRTMAAIAKYPWLKGGHPAGQSKLAQKWSFYPEAEAILDRLVKSGYVAPVIGDAQDVLKVERWVEAEIMDWADDISYAVHDIDDFYRAGLIPLGRILKVLELASRPMRWYQANFDFVHGEDVREALQYISAKLKKFQERSTPRGDLTEEEEAARARRQEGEFNAAFEQVRIFAQSLTTTSEFSGTHEAHADLRRFSSAVITYLSTAATLKIDEDTGRVQLGLDPTRVLVAEFFKAINSYFVIESVNLGAMQYGQEAKLYSLFLGLLDLATEWTEKQAEGKKGNRLPARLRSYLTTQLEDGAPAGGEDGESLIAIAVLDYITSLRDAQASHLTAQLSGAGETTAVAVAWLNN